LPPCPPPPDCGPLKKGPLGGPPPPQPPPKSFLDYPGEDWGKGKKPKGGGGLFPSFEIRQGAVSLAPPRVVFGQLFFLPPGPFRAPFFLKRSPPPCIDAGFIFPFSLVGDPLSGPWRARFFQMGSLGRVLWDPPSRSLFPEPLFVPFPPENNLLGGSKVPQFRFFGGPGISWKTSLFNQPPAPFPHTRRSCSPTPNLLGPPA